MSVGASPVDDTPPKLPRELNLKLMRLFYLFEKETIGTLGIGIDLWKIYLLPLSFDHEFLMHSILMMSSAHQHFLHPHNDVLLRQELHHQGEALSALQKIIPNAITSQNADAVFAASLLLYHHAWSACPPGMVNGLGFEDLLPLGQGLKDLFIETISTRHNIWMTVAGYNPKTTVEKWSKHTVFPANIEAALNSDYLRLPGRYLGDANYAGYFDEIQRLIPLLSISKMKQLGVDVTPLQHDLTRLALTYPILFGEEGLRLATLGDDAALIASVRFFEVMDDLVPAKYWWKERRVRIMLEAFPSKLDERGISLSAF
jgi:hypothetical protein